MWPIQFQHKDTSKPSQNSPACVHAKSLQSCPTLCGPVDCSLPGSFVHGILQTRILKWVAMPCSRGSSRPKDWTPVSYISSIGRRILYHYHHLGSPRRFLKYILNLWFASLKRKFERIQFLAPPGILVIPKLSKTQCCCFHASICTLDHKDDPLLSYLSSLSQFFIIYFFLIGQGTGNNQGARSY